MKELKEAVRDAWNDAIDTNAEIVLPELAGAIIDKNRESLVEWSRQLAFRSILDMLKSMAKTTVDDSGQMELFGFPAVIAIPTSENQDYVYLKSTAARFEQLKAGCFVRENNVQKAQAALDLYHRALELVEPIMDGTDMTLMQAVEKESQEGNHAKL